MATEVLSDRGGCNRARRHLPPALIDAELPPSDGAAVFNRMYLTVTEQVAARLEDATVFVYLAFMAAPT